MLVEGRGDLRHQRLARAPARRTPAGGRPRRRGAGHGRGSCRSAAGTHTARATRGDAASVSASKSSAVTARERARISRRARSRAECSDSASISAGRGGRVGDRRDALEPARQDAQRSGGDVAGAAPAVAIGAHPDRRAGHRHRAVAAPAAVGLADGGTEADLAARSVEDEVAVRRAAVGEGLDDLPGSPTRCCPARAPRRSRPRRARAPAPPAAGRRSRARPRWCRSARRARSRRGWRRRSRPRSSPGPSSREAASSRRRAGRAGRAQSGGSAASDAPGRSGAPPPCPRGRRR